MCQWSQWVCILTATLYVLMLARNTPCSSSLLSAWKTEIYLHQPFNPFSSRSLIAVAFIHNLQLSPLCIWLSNLNSILKSVPRTTSKCPMACDLLHLNVRSRTLNSVHPYLSSPFLLYFIKKEMTLLYLKWITTKDLLYNTRNSAQCYVAAWIAGEFGREWIDVYIHDWVALLSTWNYHNIIQCFLKKQMSFSIISSPKTSSPRFLFICSWFILQLSMSAPFYFLYLPLPHPLTTTCLQGCCNRLWSLTSLIQLKKPCQSDLLKHCSDHLTSLSKNFHVSWFAQSTHKNNFLICNHSPLPIKHKLTTSPTDPFTHLELSSRTKPAAALYTRPLSSLCLSSCAHLAWDTVSLCCCLIAKSCPTLTQPHGPWPPRLPCPWDLKWVAISLSRGSSQPRNGTCISCIGRQILYCWATWESHCPFPQTQLSDSNAISS